MSMTNCFCFSSNEDEFHKTVIYHQYCFESSLFATTPFSFSILMTSCEFTKERQKDASMSELFNIIILPVVT